MNLGAVIPAAGYSSRMGGGFKPLMRLQAKSLLAWNAELLQTAGVRNSITVAGHRGDEVAAEAKRLGLCCVHNPRPEQGMLSSIQTAVRNLSGIDAFFLLPVDIPLIRPATLTTLRDAYDGRSVVLPCFSGRRGHPPLIPATLIPAILASTGPGGLGALLAGRAHREVAVWDRGILLDADTPEDFAGLKLRAARLAIGDPGEAAALADLTMPPKGVAHGRAVACVAAILGEGLNRRGFALDLDLVYNGALLHDIAKGVPNHEAMGAELLREFGLGRVADIVAVHRDLPPPPNGRLREGEVVCLADKLVRGSRRVTVAERFADKLALYAADPAAGRAIRRRRENALALQAVVEQGLGRSLEEILGSEPESWARSI